jgi:hypothetical protein
VLNWRSTDRAETSLVAPPPRPDTAYGLTRRDDSRYILVPAIVYAPDFPGETFRVLKEKKLAKFGEYRTWRLVLEEWNRFADGSEEFGDEGRKLA